MRENYIHSEYSESWFENGILVQVLSRNISEINITIAKQLIHDRKYAAGNRRPVPVIVDVGNVVNVDNEAKKYYRDIEPYDGISAVAMVVDNWVAKVIGNIVFQIQRNPIPIELFNNKEKAFNWLEKYK